MTPYYQDDAVTLYHGDSHALQPHIAADGRGDLVTDPPYGIGYRSNHNSGRYGDWAKWTRDDNFDSIAGDEMRLNPSPWLRFRKLALCGGNYIADLLPASRCWVTWDKREGIAPNDQADCEYVWTNFPKPSRIYRHLWSGLLRAGRENVAKADKFHPHQKPEGLMEFLILYGECEGPIIDPFAGSGTTLVAAKRLGRKAIGIEINEQYCEIAARRLSQGALPLEFVG